MSLKLGDTTETVSGNSLQDVALQFRQIVKEALADPGELTPDGRFTSFVTPGDLESAKPGRKAGYAVIDPLKFICCYGSHRPGECAPVVLEIEIPGAFKPSQADREALLHQAQQQRTQNAEDAAQRAQAVWAQCEIDLRQHGYLVARGVLEVTRPLGGHCVRLFPKNSALVIPMLDAAGKLWNRQAIARDGRKKFLEGGRLEGLGVWIPGPPAAGQRWHIAEGFAKALAVYVATGSPCLCSFTAGNLGAAIAEHGAAITPRGTIAADSDAAGKVAADSALQRFPQLKVIYPPAGAGDWNDLLVKNGMEALKAALLNGPPQHEPPAPLRREPPDPEPFPMDALGDVLSPAALAMQSIIQAPDALLGQSVLGAASLVTQAHGSVIIDGRISPLSLFFLTIAASGERKSATDTGALKPVMEKQRELSRCFGRTCGFTKRISNPLRKPSATSSKRRWSTLVIYAGTGTPRKPP